MDGYNYYDPYSPAPQEGSQALSIVSLVLGIVSIVMSIASICCCGLGGAPFSIAAIICGIIAKAKKKPGQGMALAGIITGVVGILAGIIVLIIEIIISGGPGALADAFMEGFEQGYNGSY